MQIRMHLFVFGLSGVAIALLPEQSHSQEVVKTEWDVHFNGGACVQSPGLPVVIGANVTVVVRDWHPLKEDSVVRQMLTPYPAEGMRRCPSGNSVGVRIKTQQDEIIDARWTRATGYWNIKSFVPQLAQREDRIARDQAAAEQQRREQEAKQAEKERLKQAAQSDCGASPTLSGGPWVSSTYKVGALDEAERALSRWFLCVKAIEYISPAPNPLGGNAARAKFVGYDRFEYKPHSEIRDFFY